MLTKTVAVHYAKQNIRCNCICPAGVVTHLLQSCWRIHRPRPGSKGPIRWVARAARRNCRSRGLFRV